MNYFKKFKWGIIGYGNIGKNFHKVIQRKKNNSLLGISSKTNKSLSFKNVSNYQNEIALLGNSNRNSIYISNLNTQHYSSAINSINFKKNLIIEKPSFINEKEVNTFVASLKESNLFAMEGYMNLYHPQMNIVKNLILEKEIGDLLKIDLNIGFNIKKKFLFFKYHKFKKSHRLLDKEKGGGAILDIGCYTIVTARNIVNNIFNESIDFKLEKIQGKIGITEVDESASARVSFKNNIYAYLKCSIVENLSNNISIIGSKGKIIIPEPWTPSANPSIILDNKNGKKIIKVASQESSYWYELDFFNNVLNEYDEVKKNKIKKKFLDNFLVNTSSIINWLKGIKS